MLKSLRRLFGCHLAQDKYAAQQPTSSNSCWNELNLQPSAPLPSPPPPSYGQVIEERRRELSALEAKLVKLGIRRSRAMRKFVYAESRYLNLLEELEQMKTEQQKVLDRCLRKGRALPDQAGFRLCRKILLDEIEYLKRYRAELKTKFLMAHNDLIRYRSRICSLRRRLDADLFHIS